MFQSVASLMMKEAGAQNEETTDNAKAEDEDKNPNDELHPKALPFARGFGFVDNPFASTHCPCACCLATSDQRRSKL